MKIIAFIPARSGSTRLKNKNIKIINGEPLIYWTVSSAIKAKIFDQLIFSSDSKKYYEILIKSLKKNKLPTNKIFFDLRKKKDASKTKRIFDYIKTDLLIKYKFKKEDLLVQMLPTGPLRSIVTIKKAVNLARKTKKDIFSVNEYDFHISFAIKFVNENKWKTLFKNSPINTGNTRSQDQEKYFKPNPIINCLWLKNITKDRKSIYKNAIAIKTNKIESLDIDNLEDFNLVNSILRGHIKQKYI
tara:strand:- start:778 stop:1509 length:732 start_codon:yes stop_codon:yes gene_type:complete